jgi:hypothetical protein
MTPVIIPNVSQSSQMMLILRLTVSRPGRLGVGHLWGACPDFNFSLCHKIVYLIIHMGCPL